MRRKVIQIADSTQLVSIPRKWALSHGIKKGDELDVEEVGSTIVISTEHKNVTRRISINIGNMDRDSLLYAIRAAYTQGFDEITLTFDNNQTEDFRRKKTVNTLDVINQEVSRLNGVEVFSQTKNSCIIKSISIDTEREFDNLFNRILYLVRETMGEYLDAYENGRKDALPNIESKHDLISKFVYYCERILSKGIYKDVNKTKNLATLLNYLDLCVDSIKYSARLVINQPHKPSADTLKHFREVHEQFMAFIKLYKKFSHDDLKRINQQLINSGDEFEKLLAGKNPTEAKVIAYMNTFLENLRFLVFSAINIYYASQIDKKN